MTEPELPDNNDESNALVQERTAQLIRTNEALRGENQRLLSSLNELKRRMVAAFAGSESDRSRRRAALNLLEDAEQARKAELRESTERHRVEDELRQINRRKDEFLATLAHELRNPLAPIRNSLHILRMAGADDGAAERVRAMLERQVNHLVRLVDDLMEVSRITRGKIELRLEQLELASVVRSAVESSKPFIERGNHQLAISVPSEPLTLLADPVRLSQVISNLLNNAAKYTNDGGQIWLTVRRDGSSAVISVRDNGEGIPPEMIPSLFELFTQIDRTLGRAQGGLGIGLSLARTLVEAHGGSIEAKSEGVGKGSEFIVRLKLVRPQFNLPVAQSDGRFENFTDCRVLVVDDNSDAAESLAMLLKLYGAEVCKANDGPAALETLGSFHPSVMFLDLGMPGMDGYEVAREVRQRPDGQNVLLIALTGWGQEDDRRRTREAGFDYHLVKPAELSDLQAIMASVPHS